MKAFYISCTHWDREWIEPFQEFRMRLVQAIDDAMDLLDADADFPPYHLDGQVVILEDYLEIRPENRERLLGHVKSGRMPTGPWYVQADEWLASGEACIRNLQLGVRRARRLGIEPIKVGYVPDVFGHISSTPMILAGFGLKGCVVWRGMLESVAGQQFRWVGPDGSEILTHKLSDDGGYGGFFIVRLVWQRNERSAESLREAATEHFKNAQVNAPLYYLSDSSDGQKHPESAPEMLALLREQFPDTEFICGSMEDYFDELAKHADALPEFRGEMRLPAREVDGTAQFYIPHTVSSRYPLKQLNDRCQNLLTIWAEPLAAMAALIGSPVPQGYLDKAWEWLIKNLPHDSICGCSVDAVHRDMMGRFDQCLRLADGVRRQGMAALGEPTHAIGEAYRNVVVHNPLPWPRREVVELDLLLPGDFQPQATLGGLTGPRISQFELLDCDGNPLPYQPLGIDRRRRPRVVSKRGHLKRAASRPAGECDVYRVAVPLQLPAGGYTSLQVRPLTDKRYRDRGTLRTAPLAAENAHIRFELRSDGTGVLEHRASGRTFEGLLTYQDGGDIGDGWTYAPPASDRRIVTPGHRVQCGIEHDGSQMVTFRVDRVLSVPAGVDAANKDRRGDQCVDLRITDFITLTADGPLLRVRTVVQNTAGNHRLRVLLPSGIASDGYYADQPFAFVERPVAVDPASASYKEADPCERPHHRIFGIEDGDGGLAVLCPEGLHEHSVLDDAARTLALTLLRCTSTTVMTDTEPDGQLIGRHEFVYALLPYAGSLERAAALRETAALQAGCYCHFSAEPPGTRSLIEVTGDDCVVVTAVKPVWDSGDVVVRFWNTAACPATAAVKLDVPVQAAWLCELAEEKREELPVADGAAEVRVPAFGLATVRIAPGV